MPLTKMRFPCPTLERHRGVDHMALDTHCTTWYPTRLYSLPRKYPLTLGGAVPSCGTTGNSNGKEQWYSIVVEIPCNSMGFDGKGGASCVPWGALQEKKDPYNVISSNLSKNAL